MSNLLYADVLEVKCLLTSTANFFEEVFFFSVHVCYAVQEKTVKGSHRWCAKNHR